MSDETGEAGRTRAQQLQRAYEAAVLEFNLATVPLIVALTAQAQPSVTEIVREEAARAIVVETRRKVWAEYGADEQGHA